MSISSACFMFMDAAPISGLLLCQLEPVIHKAWSLEQVFSSRVDWFWVPRTELATRGSRSGRALVNLGEGLDFFAMLKEIVALGGDQNRGFWERGFSSLTGSPYHL